MVAESQAGGPGRHFFCMTRMGQGVKRSLRGQGTLSDLDQLDSSEDQRGPV